jgi:hypothetical protein
VAVDTDCAGQGEYHNSAAQTKQGTAECKATK